MNVVYLGSGDIGLPSLRGLLDTPDVTVLAVVTQPDRAAGRGLAMRPPRIKQLAASRGIPVLQPEKIRRDEAVAQIAALQPDLLVVMAYGQILPQSLLDAAPLGALNLHASLLPRHRGAAPVHAALLAGDRVTGITAMWMDAGLDTGDVLLACELGIAPDETAGSLHDRLAALAPEALGESMRLIREGIAPRTKQDGALATYAPKLDRSAGRIDWMQSAGEIARRIRALHPWPGSSAELAFSDGRVAIAKILRAEAVPGSALPGHIGSGFLAGCGGGGLLRILEIQIPGGRAMTADEFLHGHHPDHFAGSASAG